MLASMPKGAFIERPMGAYSPEEQARNLMEVAPAAGAARLDARSRRCPVPIEIWLGGTVSAFAERAGRLGDAWLTGQNATDADLVQHLEQYQKPLGAPTAPRLAARHLCRRVRRRGALGGQCHSSGRLSGLGPRSIARGSAETVVQTLRRYCDMGFDYVMVRHIVGDHQLMLRSFERIGRDVMPQIRRFE
jgi:alkanesulfonate monooxygenase SsuD/methylene tetrahydromethanopterin reductase-like flavin-dependent oxidoreductase (luciferase family)